MLQAGRPTSMHDLQFVLEEAQTPYHGSSNSAQNGLGYSLRRLSIIDLWLSCLDWLSSASKRVERASVHVFHTVVNTRLNGEGSVKLDDFGCFRSMQNIKLHNDTIELGFVKL